MSARWENGRIAVSTDGGPDNFLEFDAWAKLQIADLLKQQPTADSPHADSVKMVASIIECELACGEPMVSISASDARRIACAVLAELAKGQVA